MKTAKRITLLAVALMLLFAMALFTVSCGGGQPAETSHVHSYKSTVVAPTCAAEGYTEHVCACGHSYRDTTVAVDPTAHDLTSRVIRFPTTLTKGLREDSCTRCSHKATREMDTVSFTLPGVSEILAKALGEGTFSFGIGNGAEIGVTTNRTELDPAGNVTGTSSSEESIVPTVKKATFTIEGTHLTGEIDVAITAGKETATFRFFMDGDDVSVETNGEKTEANLSEAFYDAICEAYEIDREQLTENVYLAKKLTEYVPVLEALATLVEGEVFNAEFTLIDLLTLMGEEAIAETTEDGYIIYDLDIAAALAVLGEYGDKSLTDILDQRYGDGTGKAFFDYLAALPDKPLGELVDEALDLCEAYEVDYQLVYQLINYLAFNASGENFDLEAEILERQDMTFATLVADASGMTADAFKSTYLAEIQKFRTFKISYTLFCEDPTHLPLTCDCTTFDDTLAMLEGMASSLVESLTIIVNEETGVFYAGHIATGAFELVIEEEHKDFYEITLLYDNSAEGWLQCIEGTLTLEEDGSFALALNGAGADNNFALEFTAGDTGVSLLIAEGDYIIAELALTTDENGAALTFYSDELMVDLGILVEETTTETESLIVLTVFSGDEENVLATVTLVSEIENGEQTLSEVVIDYKMISAVITYTFEGTSCRMTVEVAGVTMMDVTTDVTVKVNADGTTTETLHIETEGLQIVFDAEETKTDTSSYISAYIEKLLSLDIDLIFTYPTPAAE